MFSRLTLNSGWLLIARIGTQVGLAFFTIILARQVGSSRFGEYTFIASVVVIGNTLSTFGTDMFLIREIAATDRLTYLLAALIVQIVLSGLLIVVIFVASPNLPNLDTEAVIALRIYSFSLIPLAFFTVFTTMLRGEQQMAAYASLNLILTLLQLIAIFILIFQGGGLINLAILLLFVQTAGTLLAGYLCRTHIHVFYGPWSGMINKLWKLTKACAPIALLGLLGILYQRLSSILILSLSGTTWTGNYSAAARIVEAAKIGHVAVFTAIYPLMAQVHATDKSNWIRTFRLPIIFLLSGSIIAAWILFWLAKPFICILFGSGYISAVPPLQVLVWILIPYTINSLMTLAFLAKGDVGIIMIVQLAGIITLTVLTIWWEPIMNLKGAALAALSSEILQAIILISQVYRLQQIVSEDG